MRTVIINENERGFLFKNGKYAGVLGAGKYREYGGRRIELSSLDEEVKSGICPIEVLLGDGKFKDSVDVVEVADNEIALHYKNGIYEDCIRKRGKHAFWKVNSVNEFKKVDVTDPEFTDEIPKYVFTSKNADCFTKRVEVSEYQKGLLFYDGRFVKVLDPGTHVFWETATDVKVRIVDTRLRQMNVVGQEIMTQDKVSVRVNVVFNYRITDFVKSYTEIDDFEGQMYVSVQLALRDYIGKNKLDDILQSKDEMSEYVFHRLKEKEGELYVEIKDAGVKDIILPGEIRDIMNTVLIAEKRAQANVITRREEVASTRSLLNTAKLMEENATLYKLKELEYVERICENVGNINLNGGGDVLSQLVGMMQNAKTE